MKVLLERAYSSMDESVPIRSDTSIFLEGRLKDATALERLPTIDLAMWKPRRGSCREQTAGIARDKIIVAVLEIR
jgi:hypothetical protein